MKAESKLDNIWMGVFLIVFLAIVAITLFIDIARVDLYNSDTVVDMNYAKVVWESKAIFPDGWYYTTETFVHRPFFFPALFYGLTGNLLISYAAGMIAGGLLVSVIVYRYFCLLEINKVIALVGLCCLWTLYPAWVGMFVSLGYYYSGVYGAVFLAIWAYQSQDKRLRYLACFSALMMGMASLRMVVFLYAPLLLLGGLEFLYNRRKGKLNDYRNLVYAAKLMLCNVVGYLFLVQVLKRYFGVTWGTAHIEFHKSINEIFSAASVSFRHICEVLWLGDPVMEALAIMAVLTAVYIVKADKNAKRKQALVFFTLSEVCVCCASSSVVGMEIAGRYHVSVTFFVVLTLIFLLDDLVKTGAYKKLAIALGLVLVVFGTYKDQWVLLKPVIMADKNIPSNQLGPYADLADVADYLMAQKIGRAYATYWYAEPIELYSNGSIEAGHFDMNFDPYLWGTEKKLYVPEGYKGTVAVVVYRGELDKFSDRGKEILRQGTFMKEINGKYLVYTFLDNPIVLR